METWAFSDLPVNSWACVQRNKQGEEIVIAGRFKLRLGLLQHAAPRQPQDRWASTTMSR
jgi:hypothetical protein